MTNQDQKGMLLSLLGIDDIDDVSPEIMLTVLSIFGAIIKLVRHGGGSEARLFALMRAAEAVKEALDREKFPEDYRE